jgi:hypothetical protein
VWNASNVNIKKVEKDVVGRSAGRWGVSCYVRREYNVILVVWRVGRSAINGEGGSCNPSANSLSSKLLSVQRLCEREDESILRTRAGDSSAPSTRCPPPVGLFLTFYFYIF